MNELRDRLMLLEVCQLIGTPHLLPLLRERAEATEMLLRVKGAAGAGDPTALAMMGGGGAGATPARRLEMEAPPSSVEVGEALRVEVHRGDASARHSLCVACVCTCDGTSGVTGRTPGREQQVYARQRVNVMMHCHGRVYVPERAVHARKRAGRGPRGGTER